MADTLHRSPLAWAWVILLALSGIAVRASAAEAPNLLSGYSNTSWSRLDGLPPGNIWALAQDADGYLWLGTDVGLVRFDGVRFVDAETLGFSALLPGAVRTLFVARDTSLWIGYIDGGLTRLRNGVATTYSSAEGRRIGNVSAIVEDKAGRLLAVSGDRLLSFDGGQWTRWDKAPAHAIRAIGTGPAGDLLVAAGNEVLRSDAAGAFTIVARSAAQVQAVSEDRHGGIWVTDPIVGFRRAGGSGIDDDRRGRGTRLLTDRQSNLWVATFGQGVWRVTTDPRGQHSVELVSDITGLSNSSVLALLEDRDGNIWVGTTDGLNRLTPDRFAHVQDLGLVTGVVTTSAGDLWAGTAEGVVRLVERNGTLQPAGRYLEHLPIRGLHADAGGALWAATERGVYRLDTRGRDIEPVIVIEALRAVSGITSSARGDLWLYDNTRGLVHWRNGRIETRSLPAEFADAYLGSLVTDRRGRTWIGFEDRADIVAIDPDNRARTYGAAEGLESGRTRSIHEDRSGTIWIAGSSGIARLTDDRFVTLREGNDFLGTLMSVVEGIDGRLWFGSAWGLVRMHPRDFDRAVNGAPGPATHDLFDASYGVPGTTRWAGQPNVAVAPDGRLWFLTARGVTIVDPRTLTDSPRQLAVQIDDVTADGRRLDIAGGSSLEPLTRRVEISYTLPELNSARRTRFRYRLDGFDRDWVDGGTRRRAIYTNLPPQSYTFRVQAADHEGAWPGTEAIWAFAVAPAFYQTGWFYGSLALAGALIVGGGWRLRLLRVRRDFTLLLCERVRLSRELHDTLLQSLVGVSLQLNRLSNDLEPSSGGRERVTQIRRLVDDYVRDARQSIWNLRSSTLEHTDLAGALRQAGERFDTDVAFELAVTGTPRRYAPTVEEHLLRIGKEAVSNAVRHSSAKHITIQLEHGDGTVALRVADDGCGFDPAALKRSAEPGGNGHWGLLTMEERTSAMGGTFRLASATENGTVVEAVVPVPRG